MTPRSAAFKVIFALSFVTLLLERIWRSFWPALSIVFVFAGLACLKFFFLFTAGVHAALLLLFIAAFFAAAHLLGPAFHMPDAAAVRRAIEKQSGLHHRPLEAMTDAPVQGTSVESRKLWQQYQERLQKIGARLRIHRPQPNVAAQDKHNIRFAALLLLLLGVGVARQETLFRISEAATPDVRPLLQLAPVALDAWITPPAYTHINPIFLATTQLGAAATAGHIEAPENSVLKVRLSGYSSAPQLSYDGVKYAFTQTQPKDFTLEMPLTKSGELKISQWYIRSLGHWPVTIVEDHAPGIVVLKTETTKRNALKITYMAKDDYHIKSVTGTIKPTPELLKTFGTKTVDFDMPVPDNGDKEMDYVTDLTAHPWAGSPVLLTLSAADDAGHVTESAPETVTLPERVFTNPVAQRIIANRKKLIWYGDEVTQKLVITDLSDVASHPENYKWDNTTFLGLAMAVKRMAYDGSDAAMQTVIPFLWDLAVRVEDGGLQLAARELSDSLQKLSDGLKDKSLTKEQVQELMDNVQQKMREYVKNLASEMQQRQQDGKQMPQMSPELANKIMKNVDMQKLMDQMQQLSQGSEREQMEKMAQYLKNSVDNMDWKKLDQMQKGQRESMEGLDDLQKLIERQQQLMDKTNKLQPKDQQDPSIQPPEDKPQDSKPPQPDKKDADKQDSKQEQPQKNDADKSQSQQQQSSDKGDQKSEQQQQGQSGSQQQDQQQQQSGNAQQGQQQQGQQGQQGQSQSGQGQASSGQDKQQSDGTGTQQQGQQSGSNSASGDKGPPMPVPTPENSGTPQPGMSGNPQQQQQAQGNAGDKQDGPPQPMPAPGDTAQDKTPQTGQGQTGQQPSPQQAGQQAAEQNQSGQSGAAQGNAAGAQQQAQQSGQQTSQQQGQQMSMPGEAPNDAAVPKADSKAMKQAEQQAAPQSPPIHSTKDGMAEQGTLRDKLGDIMRKIGEGLPQLPDNFGKADQAMRQSGQELKENDAKGSLPYQKEALDQLNGAMDKSVKQMADQLQTTLLNFGFMPGGAEKGFGQGFDPLGRNMGNTGNPNTESDIKIPDEKERRRVQEIIEELRTRSNDYSRPRQEREYIDRLLDQFN